MVEITGDVDWWEFWKLMTLVTIILTLISSGIYTLRNFYIGFDSSLNDKPYKVALSFMLGMCSIFFIGPIPLIFVAIMSAYVSVVPAVIIGIVIWIGVFLLLNFLAEFGGFVFFIITTSVLMSDDDHEKLMNRYKWYTDKHEMII